jgi:hypothetical protein
MYQCHMGYINIYIHNLLCHTHALLNNFHWTQSFQWGHMFINIIQMKAIMPSPQSLKNLFSKYVPMSHGVHKYIYP